MKKYLLTGLVLLLPIVLTLMIIFFLFDLFTEPFFYFLSPLVEDLPFSLPHSLVVFLSRMLSLLLLVVLIFLLGVITQLFIVDALARWSNRLIFRIPFISTVYRVSRDIFAALFSTDGKKAFKRPVMIPFPSKPNYCLGFEAGDVAQECQEKAPVPLKAIFAPTAPHPVSGFLFLVPISDVHSVDMTNEEVVKFLVSCGTILPETEQEASDDLPF